MRKSKLIYLLLAAFIMSALVITCTIDEPNNPRQPRQPSEPVVATCLDKVGTSIFIVTEITHKQSDVYKVRAETTDNCHAKFLDYQTAVSIGDTLCLCETSQVGKAFYVLDSVEVVGSLNEYHFLQGRETVNGVFNNDAVCDAYANYFKFHMEVLEIPGTWALGDTIYLGFN